MCSIGVGCSDKQDDMGEEIINPSFILTDLVITVDGSEIASTSLSGFEIEKDLGIFSYEDSGGKEGQWNLNEEGTELSISYDDVALSLPVITQTEETLTVEMASVDLDKSDFTGLEQKILLIANQSILQDGGDGLNEYMTNGSDLKILFNITY